MKPDLLRLAARLLRTHSREVANHGCNDFDLKEAGVPETLWEDIVREAETDNRSPEQYTPGLPADEYRRLLPDFQVASWLARKLEQDADGR